MQIGHPLLLFSLPLVLIYRAGQRLAKRKARKEQLVKFRFCPMTSECSTAYNVRKFQQGPARVLVGAALIGQDSLEPHPVVQEDAERPGCTTRTRFFF